MDAGITPRDHGFTLIELMIVVAVLSLLTLTVTLGVNRPRTAQADDWTAFRDLHDRMREQAVTGDAVLGLSLSPDGFARLHRDAAGWVEDTPPSAWRGAVDIRRPVDPRPVVVFLPNGRSTPVRLAFAAAGPLDGSGMVCESNGWEPLECAAR